MFRMYFFLKLKDGAEIEMMSAGDNYSTIATVIFLVVMCGQNLPPAEVFWWRGTIL